MKLHQAARLSDVGRIFYGISMAVLGFQTAYGRDFPYMIIPYKHSWIPGLGIVAVVSGCAIMWAAACIILKRATRPASLLLGSVLLLVFVFYYVPYQLVTSSYRELVLWENAEKELALSCGAFVIAGCFPANKEAPLFRALGRLIPLGAILFSITIISFGIIHFQFAKDVAEYVPAWVPARLFWAYFCGAALIGSGLAVIFKVKAELAALLLGLMIFGWFVVLHVPRVIVSTPAYLRSEITSAFLAFAYSGIALVIAGKKRARRKTFMVT